MNIFALSPRTPPVDVSATTTGGTNRQALGGTVDQSGTNCWVVNEGTSAAIVALGNSSVDASSAADRVVIPAGQGRVITAKPGATHADAVLRAGAATVSFQLITGV